MPFLARRLLALLLLLAIFNSAWSAFAEWIACHSCITAADLAGDLPLGLMGMFYYGALFVFSLASPQSKLLHSLIYAAAVMHAFLAGALLYTGIACPPCIATSLCAWAAAGVVACGRWPVISSQ